MRERVNNTCDRSKIRKLTSKGSKSPQGQLQHRVAPAHTHASDSGRPCRAAALVAVLGLHVHRTTIHHCIPCQNTCSFYVCGTQGGGSGVCSLQTGQGRRESGNTHTHSKATQQQHDARGGGRNGGRRGRGGGPTTLEVAHTYVYDMKMHT